jgi:hypothetical protein
MLTGNLNLNCKSAYAFNENRDRQKNKPIQLVIVSSVHAPFSPMNRCFGPASKRTSQKHMNENQIAWRK